MTVFSPLRQASSDDVELALLRSTDRDEPSARAMARTAAALGLGASVTTLALEAAAADTTTSGLASTASSSIWISALKALAIGTIGGTVMTTAAHAVFSESPVDRDRASDSRRFTAPDAFVQRTAVAADAIPSAQPLNHERISDIPGGDLNSDPVRAALSPARTPLVTAASRGETAQSPGTTRAVDPGSPTPPGNPVGLPSEARAAYQTLPATNVSRPSQSEPAQVPASQAARSAPKSASIADEVRAIERARQALNDGRARDALAELQRYETRWPGGVFSAEALVLRVQARIQLGDRASAVREANALISAQPNSRHASRLRALLGIPTTK
jgi:hypothetical protein